MATGQSAVTHAIDWKTVGQRSWAPPIFFEPGSGIAMTFHDIFARGNPLLGNYTFRFAGGS